jgi:hypothetical protein
MTGGLIVRRFLIAAGAVVALSGVSASGAGAAPNPQGTGQPGAPNGVSCPANITTPPGFNSGGFANAETHYANPGTTPAQSTHAVAQYDIACYQTSQPHP